MRLSKLFSIGLRAVLFTQRTFVAIRGWTLSPLINLTAARGTRVGPIVLTILSATMLYGGKRSCSAGSETGDDRSTAFACRN